MSKLKQTPSLREFGRAWAPVFGLSSEEMYGRQRALNDAGLIEGDRKSGPGRGARQTPWNTALLLTALLSAPTRVDTEKTIKAFAYLRTVDPELLCPLTAEEFFVNALTEILRSEEMLEMLSDITVIRTEYAAYIKFFEVNDDSTSAFRGTEERRDVYLPTIQASIPGSIFRQIANWQKG